MTSPLALRIQLGCLAALLLLDLVASRLPPAYDLLAPAGSVPEPVAPEWRGALILLACLLAAVSLGLTAWGAVAGSGPARLHDVLASGTLALSCLFFGLVVTPYLGNGVYQHHLGQLAAPAGIELDSAALPPASWLGDGYGWRGLAVGLWLLASLALPLLGLYGLWQCRQPQRRRQGLLVVLASLLPLWVQWQLSGLADWVMD